MCWGLCFVDVFVGLREEDVRYCQQRKPYHGEEGYCPYEKADSLHVPSASQEAKSTVRAMRCCSHLSRRRCLPFATSGKLPRPQATISGSKKDKNRLYERLRTLQRYHRFKLPKTFASPSGFVGRRR